LRPISRPFLIWTFRNPHSAIRIRIRPSMSLHVLPFRTGSAAENMACDFLLLQRYPEAAAPRFRHYGWHRPAFTFGYSQKIAFVRAALPPGGPFDLCRRPTGGGIVDHRDDWTYSLVIPRGHPLEELRATQSYREIHESLAAALRSQGVPARTKPVATEPEISAKSGLPAGVCFERAEFHDVVHETTGAKIAGAAQKRNKHGLLFQGSIWRPAAGGDLDWERFHDDFVVQLTRALDTPAEAVPWPELPEAELEGLTEQYATPEWLEHR
jgi:lipoate-protein ligase A